jgi:hypothetical protein
MNQGFRRRHLLASLGLLGWRPSFLRAFLSLVMGSQKSEKSVGRFRGYYLI